MATLRFGGADYDCRGSETVLEAMLRQDAVVPYSCPNGVCLTCMMRSRAGAVPACAQNGLKDTLRVEGHFLACLCTPQGDLDIELPNDAEVFGRATVRAVEQIAPTIRRWSRLRESAPI